MTSERDDSRLVEYLYGELSDDESRAFVDALGEDLAASEDVEGLAEVLSMARELDPPVDPPTFLDAKILAAARQTASAAVDAQRARGWRRWLTGPMLGGVVAATAATMLVVLNLPLLQRPPDAPPSAMAIMPPETVAPVASAAPVDAVEMAAEPRAELRALEAQAANGETAASRHRPATVPDGARSAGDSAERRQNARALRAAKLDRPMDDRAGAVEEDGLLGYVGSGSGGGGRVAGGAASGRGGLDKAKRELSKDEDAAPAEAASTERSQEESKKTASAPRRDAPSADTRLAGPRGAEVVDDVAQAAAAAAPKPAAEPATATPQPPPASRAPAPKAPAVAPPPGAASVAEAEAGEGAEAVAVDAARRTDAAQVLSLAEARLTQNDAVGAERVLVAGRARHVGRPTGAWLSLRLGRLLIERRRPADARPYLLEASAWAGDAGTRQRAEALLRTLANP